MAEKSGMSVSVKAFVSAITVIFVLMLACYGLTFLIPGGEYARVTNEAGEEILGEFSNVQGGLPFWKWLLSPILVLGASGSGMLIAVLAFLLVIGGAFNCLDTCGLMNYMLDRITDKLAKYRYKLMAVLMLVFMSMGAFIGSFEECVPMVPIMVALSMALGWDAITGIAMSLLATGCGFASGICNPFTVGTAQRLAGLPMFSGAWMRLVAFVLIYCLLLLFVRLHAKRIEKPMEEKATAFIKDEKKEKALITFGCILGVGIVTILSSGFIQALQDYTMIITAVVFLVAGIAAPLVSGMQGKRWLKNFGKGVVSILPSVLMILMASSIKYILEQGKILDTILFYAVQAAGTVPKSVVILFIYLLVLIMNFFISSGSAKAFMLIPLIVPLAGKFGISPQLCILAYAFGDGFSNVFYPTNPALLIGLSLAGTGYGQWVKWSWKFQLCNLLLTSGLLLLALSVGYC